MLAKLFSWVKTGFPKVDLVLSGHQFKPGDSVKGSFHVKGGLTHQTIQRLECDLFKRETGRKPAFIQPITTILMNRELDSNEETQYPFHFVLPEDMDQTSPDISYVLQTKLVLGNNRKTSDSDEIQITLLPH
ncbi:sporulation protein [Halobacillus litoralis]|uniref:Sporulation protein n=1 Tax=Halobacillus litoralis TaxID=45668 RepID=A0A845DQS0_9BACI|nr:MULTISPECIES: sporulation protein [Halobacillus]MCA1022788.1 sporulation protein [Halobacillus litoralis]MYL19538.1 sporulation protein [Halobacillus litoralis]MYL28683.1 sporulation protein [Halobacillus halophilus]MYL37886.1 sporulation protein [Halobacillus litoralis]